MRIYKRWFGEKLKYLRERAGFTKQEPFAEKVGVEIPSVSRWETGESFPSEGRFQKICEVLGVDPDEFLRFNPPATEPPSPADPALIEAVANAAREGAASALKLSPDEVRLLAAFGKVPQHVRELVLERLEEEAQNSSQQSQPRPHQSPRKASQEES